MHNLKQLIDLVREVGDQDNNPSIVGMPFMPMHNIQALQYLNDELNEKLDQVPRTVQDLQDAQQDCEDFLKPLNRIEESEGDWDALNDELTSDELAQAESETSSPPSMSSAASNIVTSLFRGFSN